MTNVTIAVVFLELKQHKLSIANQVWARGLGQGLKFSVSKQYAAHFALFTAAYTIFNPYFKIRNSQSLNT
ncbi:MAG: hypothetical protein JRI72_11600 [Deltaproteobacteria bacterium]|nr:hypothetical protein [Deltaproteobacteria bacterium]